MGFFLRTEIEMLAVACRRLSVLAIAVGRRQLAAANIDHLHLLPTAKFSTSNQSKPTMYQIEERGNPNTLEYRLFIRKSAIYARKEMLNEH